jgi:hypothetical protein
VTRDVRTYFDDVVAPLVAGRFPEVEREMIVQVHGSYGLEMGDGHSDLDAIIYLDDPLWKAQGGQVQLLLQHSLPGFAAHSPAYCETPGDPFAWPIYGHSEFNVHPLSWLLDNQANAFLEGKGYPPWEEVSRETFYELGYHLVLRDPHGIMAHLQEITAPERYPEWLWRKALIGRLRDLKGEPWEFEKALARRRMVEIRLLQAELTQRLLEIGFLISHRYHPYRKYLWLEFVKLPLAPEIRADFESLTGAADSMLPAEAMKHILRRYTEIILDRGLLSAEMLADLFAAVEGKAWTNPDWAVAKRRRQEAASAAGYDARDAWVWGLWGWA